MSNITPFLWDGEITIRVIDRDGQPWFVASDLCEALGLTNPAETVSGLDEDEHGVSTTDTSSGGREVVVVSESGLFALILKSRKPTALAFRKWVTSEVLPALRRSGVYVMPGHADTLCGTVVKPYADWSLEERRTALAEVNTARHTFNNAVAAWRWASLGFPTPPRHLLPGWWQGELLSGPSLL
jgi:anti-repressor protein